METLVLHDARSLCKSKGMGTDEQCLTEIMCCYSNKEVTEIKAAYKSWTHFLQILINVCTTSALVKYQEILVNVYVHSALLNHSWDRTQVSGNWLSIKKAYLHDLHYVNID